jgi:hypothetical protein
LVVKLRPGTALAAAFDVDQAQFAELRHRLADVVVGRADGVRDALGGEQLALGRGREHHHRAQAHVREGVDLHGTGLV